MKKIILLILSLSCIATYSFAQQGFHIGLDGNFNTIWIVNQDAYGYKEYDYKLDLGGGGGLVVGYNITDHIGFQAELNSSSEGQKYVDHDHADSTRQVSLNYISIPIMFKFTGGNSGVKFYADGGVQFNVLTSATITGRLETANENINAKSRYNSSDAGVNFGLGTDISLTKFLYINAGMSFYYSFNDINAPAWRILDREGVYKASRNATGGINVGIHYMILTGKKK